MRAVTLSLKYVKLRCNVRSIIYSAAEVVTANLGRGRLHEMTCLDHPDIHSD